MELYRLEEVGEVEGSKFLCSTSLSDSTALLIVLATTSHELIFLHATAGGDGPGVVRMPWCHDPEKEIAAMALSPSGKWLACVLISGNIGIIPTKLTLGPISRTREDSGGQPLFSEEEFTEIQVSARNDCLVLPTCALWYETRNKRPMLLYSNKGGDILFVDLLIHRLSVTLQAPQSIHNLEVVLDATLGDIYLLVTGFAGTQWLVPLEQEDQTLRETLGKIIPSQLKEINSSDLHVMSVESHGVRSIGILNSEKTSFQIYNSVELAGRGLEVVVPEETFALFYSDSILLSLRTDLRLTALLTVSSFNDQSEELRERFCQEVGVLPGGGRFLSFVKGNFPLGKRTEIDEAGTQPPSPLPPLFILADNALILLRPACSIEDLFLATLQPKVDLKMAEAVCSILDVDFRETCYGLVPKLLRDGNPGSPDLAFLICQVSDMNVEEIVRLFNATGHQGFILPHLEAWLLNKESMPEATRRQLSRMVLRIRIRLLLESAEYEYQVQEQKLKDFLLHNQWYEADSCLEDLIRGRLWSSALSVLRIHGLPHIAVREILALDPSEINTQSDSFVELVTHPDVRKTLSTRWDLAGDYLSFLDSVSDKWTEPRHLKHLLVLLDPGEYEIRNIFESIKLAKDRSEQPVLWELGLNLSRMFLKTLIRFVYRQKRPTNDNCSGSEDSESPERISSINQQDVRPISAGTMHSCFAASEGLHSWGKRCPNLLGNPSLVSGASTSKESTGSASQLKGTEQKHKKKVYTSERGKKIVQVSTNPQTAPPSKIPTHLFPLNTIVAVSCGTQHTLVLTNSGSLFSWGYNTMGQLGLGDRMPRAEPQTVRCFDFVHKSFYSDESRSESEKNVIAQDPIASISSGNYHAAAVGKSGAVYSWGWAVHGQLGHGSNINDSRVPLKIARFSQTQTSISKAVCGYAHSLFLDENGRVWACGNGIYGQLGQGDTRKHRSPVLVKDIGESGKDTKVQLISCGYFHSVALTEDRRLWTWGVTPQSLKFKALLQKRKIQAAANAASNEESAEKSADSSESKGKPSSKPTNNLQKSYQAEGLATAADTQHLKPVEISLTSVPKGDQIKEIVCGLHHSAILTDSGQLFTWGKGLEYQLGHGDKKERTVPTLVSGGGGGGGWRSVACGGEFMLGVDANGLIWGWGKNEHAQLGFESVQDGDKPRLSGKTITFQRANKSERTITLPQDSRVFVTEPTRLPGLTAPYSFLLRGSPVTRTYTEESLFDNLLFLQGTYESKNVCDLLEDAGARKMVSYVRLIDGDVELSFRYYCRLMRSTNASAENVTVMLQYYLNLFRDLDKSSILLMDLLVTLVEELAGQYSEDVHKFLDDELVLWSLPIKNTLKVSPAKLSVLDPALKLKALKIANVVNVSDENRNVRDVTQLPQELVVDAIRSGRPYLYAFGCGHTLHEGAVESLLGEIQSSHLLNSKFPDTALQIQEIFSEECLDPKTSEEKAKARKPNSCPDCVKRELSTILHAAGHLF